MERSLELENLRRSLAMLPPGVSASSLTREQAIDVITELVEVQARLERLRLSYAGWSTKPTTRARNEPIGRARDGEHLPAVEAAPMSPTRR